MSTHEVVDHDEWVQRRKAFLEREKELSRLRDELSAARRALPWERVAKEYVFDTVDGQRTLAELFDGRSQLIIYHFMYGPDWQEGCKSCSFWADGWDRNVVHLAARDITMVAVSRAPLAKLEAYKKRMGWTFAWASSLGSDFNYDYHVSFKPEDVERGDVYYNYRRGPFARDEAHGISVFFRDDAAQVYHTYSTFARGLDMVNAGYHLMDLAPKGRDEGDLDYSMDWLRRRDEY